MTTLNPEHACDQPEPTYGNFGCGTELSGGLSAQKKLYNREHRPEKKRGKAKVVWKTGSERLLSHLNPRTGDVTEELQRHDASTGWQRVSIKPAATPAVTSSSDQGTPHPIGVPTLPFKSGSQAEYARHATALGFATQQTLDWLNEDAAVFITWLYHAMLIGKETKKNPQRAKHIRRLIKKLAQAFPGCVFWLVGGDEVVVRQSSPKFDLFMKDVRLELEWTGSKDCQRSAKSKARRAPLPRSLQAKIAKVRRQGIEPAWLVPHCHAILVVFGPDGRVIPSTTVQAVVSSTIATARHQMRAERVGDKVEVEVARSIGQHGLSILEYMIKDAAMKTEQKRQQETWRAASRNLGFFDVVIDTRNAGQNHVDADGRLDAVIADFLQVRSTAHRASGLQNQHQQTAGDVDHAVKFVAGPTSLVPTILSRTFLTDLVITPVKFLTGLFRSFSRKNRKTRDDLNRGDNHDPPLSQ